MAASTRRSLELEAETELKSTKRTLDDLKAAMRSLKKSDRRSVGSRPELVRSDHEAQKKRLNLVREKASRDDLMGGAEAEAERARRERIKGTQAHIDGTTDHLADAHRTLGDTLDKTVAVADKLTDQTDSLLRTKDHTEGTLAAASEAKTRVSDLRARAWTNKCILGFAILLLLGANIAVLLFGHGILGPTKGGGGGGGGGNSSKAV